jgi:uncharacterized protein YecE (DUF72 family)
VGAQALGQAHPRPAFRAIDSLSKADGSRSSSLAMAQLTLFDEDRPSQAARLAPRLRALATQGIYFGTSSWKYEGWLGSIYAPQRYAVRGRFSHRKFEDECLGEYAATFPVAGGDFSFYQFPSPEYWRRLFEGAPATLQFGFKVPEEITVATWPGHARYGSRAGKVNDSFLSTRLFERAFVRELEPYRDRVATLIFEFGTFPRSTFATPDAFCERLGGFLAELPGGFRYAVEIRNPEYLGPAYFAALADRGVAHVFNAWTRMPVIGAQAEEHGAFTADFSVARALLRRGRTYEQAVKTFEPYQAIQEPDPHTRQGLCRIAEHARQTGKPAFLFVNNRLEGNAPSTIEAVVDSLGT